MSKSPYNAFLLNILGEDVSSFKISLRPGLAQPWLQGYVESLPILELRIVYPFDHWVASTLGGKYASRREKDMLRYLRDELLKAQLNHDQTVFVPRAYYADGIGRQFSEAVYEYLASMILRMMGFYVIKDYQPWSTPKMPDLSAFRTPEIAELVEMLRKRKLLKYGAVNEELQMLGLLGKVEPQPLIPSPGAEDVVVEVKRIATKDSGFGQVGSYVYEAGDLYDTGYVCAPDLESSPDANIGMLSLKQNGEITVQHPAEKPERYSTSESQALTREELSSVLATFKLELLKNIGIEEAVKVVCRGQKITYQEFMERLAALDPEPILTALESLPIPAQALREL